MRLQIIIKQQNPDFDKEYADEFHNGKESDGNSKDIWGVSFEIARDKKIKEYRVLSNASHELRISDNEFETIDNVNIIQCILEDGEIIVAAMVSEDLIEKTHVVEESKYSVTRYYFYLDPNKEFIHFNKMPFYFSKETFSV